MAVETLIKQTLEQLVEFINNPKNDVYHLWVFKNDIYLGSFLPKKFGKIKYALEQITLLLYIKRDDFLCEETISINKDEFSEYTFNYV